MNVKELINGEDRTLPFDLVWKVCGSTERGKLLRRLLSGDIAAEGIYVCQPAEDEMGNFRAIDRAAWLRVTRNSVRSHHRRKLPFSLNTDDEGAGFVQIFLFSNLALLELLPVEFSETVINAKVADEALFIARGQMIGHDVTCEAYFALCSGLVPPRAAKLAYHLEDLKDIWSNGKPQPGTLLKFCGTVVATYNEHKKKR